MDSPDSYRSGDPSSLSTRNYEQTPWEKSKIKYNKEMHLVLILQRVQFYFSLPPASERNAFVLCLVSYLYVLELNTRDNCKSKRRILFFKAEISSNNHVLTHGNVVKNHVLVSEEFWRHYVLRMGQKNISQSHWCPLMACCSISL